MSSSMYTAEQLAEIAKSGKGYLAMDDPRGDLLETIKIILVCNEVVYSIVTDNHQGGPIDATEVLMYMRVHPPVRRMPDGRPALLVSVLDHSLAEKLTRSGQLSTNKAIEDFQRLIVQEDKLRSIKCGKSELALLEDFLRHNSLRIKPSAWQVNHLPLGTNSPWYASYVCPIFPDVMGDMEAMLNMESSRQAATRHLAPRRRRRGLHGFKVMNMANMAVMNHATLPSRQHAGWPTTRHSTKSVCRRRAPCWTPVHPRKMGSCTHWQGGASCRIVLR